MLLFPRYFTLLYIVLNNQDMAELTLHKPYTTSYRTTGPREPTRRYDSAANVTDRDWSTILYSKVDYSQVSAGALRAIEGLRQCSPFAFADIDVTFYSVLVPLSYVVLPGSCASNWGCLGILDYINQKLPQAKLLSRHTYFNSKWLTNTHIIKTKPSLYYYLSFYNNNI